MAYNLHSSHRDTHCDACVGSLPYLIPSAIIEHRWRRLIEALHPDERPVGCSTSKSIWYCKGSLVGCAETSRNYSHAWEVETGEVETGEVET